MNSLQAVLPQSLILAATALPALLLYALGVALCLWNRRRLGQASVYGSLGFALLLVASLFGLGSQIWNFILFDSGESAASIGIRLGIVGLITTVLSLIGIGLLLAAILVRRPAAGA